MARTKLTASGKYEELVLAYIEAEASDMLVEKINNGEKGMTDCLGYIKEQARNQAQHGVAMVEDREVYGWAMHYFEEDSIKPGALRPSGTKIGVDKDLEERRKKRAEEAAELKAKAEEKKAKEEAKHGLDGQMDLFSLMGAES